MKTKTILYISLAVISSTFFAHAIENKVSGNKIKGNEQYAICKNRAQLKRQQNMLPALKEYVESSDEVNNKAKYDLGRAVWLIRSSYLRESEKINERRKIEMIPVNDKVAKARAAAENTLKVELSLCEFMYNKASTTPTKVNKKK